MGKPVKEYDCLIDVVAFFLFSITIIHNGLHNTRILGLLLMYSSFVIIRLSLSLWPLLIRCLAFFIILSSCLYETFLGVKQLLGFSISNHLLYAVTGTFDNPGPFGGWLAICSSVLLAYIIKCDNWRRDSVLKKWIVTPLLFLSVCFIPATQSRTALLSLATSIMVLLLSTSKYSLWIKKHIFLLITILCCSCFIAYTYKKPSADGRFFIDKISLNIMWHQKGKGVGLGNYQGAYGEEQASYFKKKMDYNIYAWRDINERERMIVSSPDNAFNDYFQIGVETGVVSMLLFVIIIIRALIISYKIGSIWFYGLLAYAVFSLFSCTFHKVPFLFLWSSLLALCSTREQSVRKEGLIINGSIIVVTITLLFTNIPLFYKVKKAELTWKECRSWYQLGFYDYIINDMRYSCQDIKDDAAFLFYYGHSLNKEGKYSESDSVLTIGSSISNSPHFWIIMGDNSMKLGNYEDAEKRYKEAFFMVPNRLTPLNRLAKLYYVEGDTTRFLEMTYLVESFTPKVESKETDKLREEIRDLKKNYITETNRSYYERGF